MNYQEIFNKRFEILMILLVLSSVATIFFVVNKSYYNQSEYRKG